MHGMPDKPLCCFLEGNTDSDEGAAVVAVVLAAGAAASVGVRLDLGCGFPSTSMTPKILQPSSRHPRLACLEKRLCSTVLREALAMQTMMT